jgi:hypothetical protein
MKIIGASLQEQQSYRVTAAVVINDIEAVIPLLACIPTYQLADRF